MYIVSVQLWIHPTSFKRKYSMYVIVDTNIKEWVESNFVTSQTLTRRILYTLTISPLYIPSSVVILYLIGAYTCQIYIESICAVVSVRKDNDVWFGKSFALFLICLMHNWACYRNLLPLPCHFGDFILSMPYPNHVRVCRLLTLMGLTLTTSRWWWRCWPIAEL